MTVSPVATQPSTETTQQRIESKLPLAAQRISAIALTALAGLILFTALPWEGALMLTACTSIVILSWGFADGPVYSEYSVVPSTIHPMPVILPSIPWYRRTWFPIFHRSEPIPVFDPRAREVVGGARWGRTIAPTRHHTSIHRPVISSPFSRSQEPSHIPVHRPTASPLNRETRVPVGQRSSLHSLSRLGDACCSRSAHSSRSTISSSHSQNRVPVGRR